MTSRSVTAELHCNPKVQDSVDMVAIATTEVLTIKDNVESKVYPIIIVSQHRAFCGA
jgi:hypothetical protein